MNDDIKFLKELQSKLKTQETDWQASPRYWVVGDYKMVPCPDGFHDEYHVSCPNRDYHGELNELLKDIKEDELDYLSEEAKEEFEDIGCEVSSIDWIKKYYDEDVELIPVKEEHFIHKNTMFLTKEEAQKHIELNHYHYSSKVHTYAMTAWRSPQVERLLNILENFHWNSVEIKVTQN